MIDGVENCIIRDIFPGKYDEYSQNIGRKRSMEYAGVLLALMAGIFIAIQGGINGMVGIKAGIFPAVITPVLVQIVILSAALLVNKNYMNDMMKINQIHLGWFFLFISGLLGLGVMSSMTYAIIKIGPLVAFTAVIFSQLLCSMILEHYGIWGIAHNPITIKRIGGLILILIGTKVFMK